MLKHPEITRRRIDLFLKQDIVPRIYGSRAPLKIEINEKPAKDQTDAIKGPWREVQPGFKYGPAYTTFWFRLSGPIPDDMAGKEIAVVAELGGERTVWRDNSPWCGIDWKHTDMGFLEGSIFSCPSGPPSPGEVQGRGGSRIEMIVQSSTRNPQHSVHIRELPREALVETVDGAEVVVVDRDMKALHYDLEFALSLLDNLEKDGPSYAT